MKIFCFYVLALTFIFLQLSCRKEEKAGSMYAEAVYSIEVTGKWALPDFTVPPNVHFTNFVGMVHNAQSELWKAGKLASKGIENVSETGNTAVAMNEIDTMIFNKKALSLILFTPPGATTSKKASIFCNTNYSYVSFASMIAPSPDWFIGVTGLNLYQNNNWIADTTLPLYVYDAGTEEGDIFGYNNPATEPQMPIQLLDASKATVLSNGNPILKPVATVKFVRL